MQDKTAIILLNWNSLEDTVDCINSLNNMVDCSYDIFLVDNYSTDGSWEKIKTIYKESPNIMLLSSVANLGFAGGNNIGIRAAIERNYSYYWLLNVDTEVHPLALSRLVISIKKDRSIGVVGSKILYHGTNKIWYAGGKVNLFTGKVSHVGMGEEENKANYNLESETGYITGCSLLVTKEVIDEIGLMREDYFLYYEETDWNIRIKKAGWKTIYCPESIVYHKVSQSTGGEKNPAGFVAYYTIRNAFALIIFTQPFYKYFSALCFLLIKFLYKLLIVYLFNYNKKKERVWYIYQGLIHGFKLRMGKHPIYKN